MREAGRGNTEGQKGYTDILAIHPGALGDVILFGHLLGALRSNATLVAGNAKARLLRDAGVVCEALDYDAMPFEELFSDAPARKGRLAGMLGRCGRIVSCFVEAGTPEAQRLERMCTFGGLESLPVRPPGDWQGHITELWGQRLGLNRAVEPFPWAIPPFWRTDAAEALGQRGLDPAGPYAVLHPGAGAEDKCWPIERFAKLADELRSAGLGVVSALGPVELDRWPDGQRARLAGAGAVLESASLTTLAGVLAGASVFVGNDSGPAHLAAAVATPTVAMFGPTRAEQFAPLGPSVACLQGDAMADIGVARVARTVRELVRWPG